MTQSLCETKDHWGLKPKFKLTLYFHLPLWLFPTKNPKPQIMEIMPKKGKVLELCPETASATLPQIVRP